MLIFCDNCKGYGYVKVLNDFDEIYDMECPYCKGTGMIEEKKGEKTWP